MDSEAAAVTTLPDEILGEVLSQLPSTASLKAASLTSRQYNACARDHLWHSVTTVTTCDKKDVPSKSECGEGIHKGMIQVPEDLPKNARPCVGRLRIYGGCQSRHDNGLNITSILEALPNLEHLYLQLPRILLQLDRASWLRSLEVDFRLWPTPAKSFFQINPEAHPGALPTQAIKTILTSPNIRHLSISSVSAYNGFDALIQTLQLLPRSLAIESLEIKECDLKAVGGFLRLISATKRLKSLNITVGVGVKSAVSGIYISHQDMKLHNALEAHKSTLKLLGISFISQPHLGQSYHLGAESWRWDFRIFANLQKLMLPVHPVAIEQSLHQRLPPKLEILQFNYDCRDDYHLASEAWHSMRPGVGKVVKRKDLPPQLRVIWWHKSKNGHDQQEVRGVYGEYLERMREDLSHKGVSFRWVITHDVDETPYGKNYVSRAYRHAGSALH